MMEDFYFMEWTVWRWSLFSPVSKVGHWQMIRVGVAGGNCFTKEERGTASWVGREERSVWGEDGEVEDWEG